MKNEADMRALASAIVYGFCADILLEFGGIRKAVDKIKGDEWEVALKAKIEEIGHILYSELLNSR